MDTFCGVHNKCMSGRMRMRNSFYANVYDFRVIFVVFMVIIHSDNEYECINMLIIRKLIF